MEIVWVKLLALLIVICALTNKGYFSERDKDREQEQASETETSNSPSDYND